MKRCTSTVLVFFLFAAVCSTSTFGQESNSPKTKMIKQANAYFAALDKVYVAGSTESDIDSLLDQMDKDVTYEHTNYQANFNRKTWKEAFSRNLRRGAYTKEKNQQTKITSSIPGKNYLAVEYAFGRVDDDGKWKADDERRYLVLFGFRNGKISSVRELW